jgi:hypothetical protein
MNRQPKNEAGKPNGEKQPGEQQLATRLPGNLAVEAE